MHNPETYESSRAVEADPLTVIAAALVGIETTLGHIADALVQIATSAEH